MKNKSEFYLKIIDFIDGKYLRESATNDSVKIYLKRKGSGSNPQSLILPPNVFVNKDFVAGIAMYIGDGKLSVDKYHLEFTSIDRDMIQFMADFFSRNFGFKKLRFRLRYKELNDHFLTATMIYLNINQNQVRLSQSNRMREPSISFQLGSIIFRDIFGRIIEHIISSKFYECEELRRAFLRGIFAAEGNLAISYKRNYIVCIQFTLNYNEDLVGGLIQKCLTLEQISYICFKQERDHSLTIRSYNWMNYWKAYQIGIFDLNQRKKQKFLDKVKRTKFMCKINTRLKERLLSFKNSQRQVFLTLGYSSTLINNFKSSKTDYLDLCLLLKLADYQNISKTEVKSHIETIRVNRSTEIKDKEFVDFVFNQHIHD